ncbi:MAG TPA: AAC(3) family N-acetyltransferase [Pseudomonadales bacterium]
MTEVSGELRAISAAAATGGPVTPASLARDLRDLGVRDGMLLNVHSALSRLGWVAGGAQSVIQALLEVIGSEGTLMMPAHSAHLSEPSNWRHPPAPESWWPAIRAGMPAYQPACTPTRLMGAVAESFRSWPGVLRSAHPQVSHAALGPLAAEIVAEHPLDDFFGDASPIGGLYALDGHVLLLGVGHGNNTVLHLAEARARFPSKGRRQEGAPVLVDGSRRWLQFQPLQVSDDDFTALGEDFAATGGEQRGRAGAGQAILMRARDIVDFGVPWFEAHRH